MKKLFPILFLYGIASAALNVLTWDNGAANNVFSDTANWAGVVSSGDTLSAGDSCVFASGSDAATMTKNSTIGALVCTGYTGTIGLQSYTLFVSGARVNVTGATISERRLSAR